GVGVPRARQALFKPSRVHFARDLFVVCLISHSLEVTRKQFVKLFFHLIAPGSYNFPRQRSGSLIGESIHVLRFAVGQ
ncbi:hypothetical protein KUCAC02_029122, partial [Chaenocephalus aceratus]